MDSVVTEVPSTRTQLRIEPDRQFEDGSADSTLRIQGTTRDGAHVFDSTYVETSPQEAMLLGWMLSFMSDPEQEVPRELVDTIMRETQLSEPDARQLIARAWKAFGGYAAGILESAEPDQHFKMLWDRFDRAYTRTQSAPAGSSTGGSLS